MQEEEKQEKVTALRGALRDGRNSTAVSDASASADTDGRDDDTTFRTAFQDAGREGTGPTRNSNEIAGNDRQFGSNRRSTQAKSKRSGRTNRRSGESDSSTTSPAATTDSTDERTIGRLVTDEVIKERLNPDKPQGSFSTQAPTQPAGKGGWPKGKPRKPKDGQAAAGGQQGQQETGFKIPLIRKGNVLSPKEVAELTEPFSHALESDFQALDTYLWSRQKSVGQDTHEQPVWTDVDTEELEALTRIMLRWGQHNETAATVVRGVIDASDYVEVGTVFVPRLKRTVDIMRETRKPRAKRGQVQNESAD
jgi:hypothetical protein